MAEAGALVAAAVVHNPAMDRPYTLQIPAFGAVATMGTVVPTARYPRPNAASAMLATT